MPQPRWRRRRLNWISCRPAAGRRISPHPKPLSLRLKRPLRRPATRCGRHPTGSFVGTIGAVLMDAGGLVTPQTPVIRMGDLTRLRVRTEDLGEGDVNLVVLANQSVSLSMPCPTASSRERWPVSPRSPVTCEATKCMKSWSTWIFRKIPACGGGWVHSWKSR